VNELTIPDWAVGLPPQSNENTCPYYTKAKAALTNRNHSDPLVLLPWHIWAALLTKTPRGGAL
jgi:hypothetical protein